MSRLLSVLVGALWVLAVTRIVVPVPTVTPILTWAMTGALVVYLLLVLPRVPRHTKILCGILGGVTIAIGATYGQWGGIIDGLSRAAIFPGFLATVVLLRATADQRPEIVAARRMFGALDPARRDSGIVIGTHLIGVILQVGVFAILAPILGPDAKADERREVFSAAIRGMSMVPLWSPFIVGMAVASQYLPLVPLWQIMSLGLSLTVISVTISYIGFDRNRGLAPLIQALKSLVPVAIPILIAAVAVVATTAATGLSTLQALIIALPVPCLLAIAQVPSGSVRRALKQTAGRFSQIGPETSIICISTILGMVFEASLPHTGLVLWLEALNLPAAVIIFTVIMTMNVAGLMGVHPMVTGTMLLVMFTSVPTGVSDLVLMQALLVGWGLCSGISIGSLSVATGAAMFRLPPTQLVTRTNIVFVFSTSLVLGTILSLLNVYLTG
jgi:hypothetical protein